MAMTTGRVYTVGFENVSCSAAQDLITLAAPSDAIVKLIGAYVGQVGTADVGDTEEELLPLIFTAYATAGSGGSSLTARQHDGGDASFGGTATRNNTTQGGTPIEIVHRTFNVRVGWEWAPTPDECITLGPSEIVAIELPAAPADAITLCASLTFIEMG